MVVPNNRCRIKPLLTSFYIGFDLRLAFVSCLSTSIHQPSLQGVGFQRLLLQHRVITDVESLISSSDCIHHHDCNISMSRHAYGCVNWFVCGVTFFNLLYFTIPLKKCKNHYWNIDFEQDCECLCLVENVNTRIPFGLRSFVFSILVGRDKLTPSCRAFNLLCVNLDIYPYICIGVKKL